MAEVVVRQLAFYWRDKKAVTANKVSAEFTFPSEPLYGQDEILAWTTGKSVLKITASGFTPVGGSYTTDDIEMILSRKLIPITLVIGGKLMSVDAKVTNLKYDGDSEKGTTTEEIQLSCAEPKIVGFG